MRAAKRRNPAVVIALALLLAIVAAVPVVATIPAVDLGADDLGLVAASPLLAPAELPVTLPPPAHAPSAVALEAASDHHFRVALAIAFARVHASASACAEAENRIRGRASVGSIQLFGNMEFRCGIAPGDRETGLVYFRNRYFDPMSGRFITPDPLGYVDSPSMYQGFGSSPMNYGDPMGLLVDPTGTYVGYLAVAEGAAAGGGLAVVGVGAGGLALGGAVGYGIGKIPIGGGRNVDDWVTDRLVDLILAASGDYPGQRGPSVSPYAPRSGDRMDSRSTPLFGSDGSVQRVIRALESADAISGLPSKRRYETTPMREQFVVRDLKNDVIYMEAGARKAFEVSVDSDGFVRSSKSGDLYDTSRANTLGSTGKGIFVMDATGTIYISGFQKFGTFHHSSFLAGGPVAAYGEIEIIGGKIRALNDHSGHYFQLGDKYYRQFKAELEARGADLSGTREDVRGLVR